MIEKNFNEFLQDFSRFYILMILYEGTSHGYGVIRKFKERLGKEISPSFVYPFLRQLEEKGFVKHDTVKVGAKEKKVFGLTEKGRELCIHLFKRFSSLVSIAIEPSLEICAHCGCKIYEGGYKEVVAGKLTAFCCVHCAQSYKHEKGLMKGEGVGNNG